MVKNGYYKYRMEEFLRCFYSLAPKPTVELDLFLRFLRATKCSSNAYNLDETEDVGGTGFSLRLPVRFFHIFLSRSLDLFLALRTIFSPKLRGLNR